MAETRVRNIPEDLWRRFRSICLLNGVTVNSQVIALVQAFVDSTRKGNSR